MRARDMVDEAGVRRWLLVDEADRPIEIVGRFLRFLQNRAMSPNTIQAPRPSTWLLPQTQTTEKSALRIS